MITMKRPAAQAETKPVEITFKREQIEKLFKADDAQYARHEALYKKYGKYLPYPNQIELHDDEIDVVASLHAGASFMFPDIEPVDGIKKPWIGSNRFNDPKSLLGFFGIKYSHHNYTSDLAVVDHYGYSREHSEADQAGLPCISFAEFFIQILTSQDAKIKEWLSSEYGQKLVAVVQKALGQEQTVAAAPKRESKLVWKK